MDSSQQTASMSPAASEASPMRGLCYAALIALVATAGWMRFSDRIASIAPGLAAPGAASSAPSHVQGLLELGLAPASSAEADLRAIRLPAGDAAALQQAVARKRLRLVHMPLYERDGGVGGMIQVSAGGLTQMVRLSATPSVIALPIAQSGNVSFRPVGATPLGGLAMGALTLSGPVQLPALGTGDVLTLGIVAE